MPCIAAADANSVVAVAVAAAAAAAAAAASAAAVEEYNVTAISFCILCRRLLRTLVVASLTGGDGAGNRRAVDDVVELLHARVEMCDAILIQRRRSKDHVQFFDYVDTSRTAPPPIAPHRAPVF